MSTCPRCNAELPAGTGACPNCGNTEAGSAPKAESIAGTVSTVLLILLNAIGVLLYLPVLFATVMSFDAPGSGEHWAHQYFVAANVLLGPLCLVGLASKRRRHWGAVGYLLVVIAWILLYAVCAGSFACREG